MNAARGCPPDPKTRCGCARDVGIAGPQYPLHSPETCQGRPVPIWSCRVAQGLVAVYETKVVAIAASARIANPWGLWSAALSKAREEWSLTCSAESHAAKEAIKDTRYAVAHRRFRRFTVPLPDVPRAAAFDGFIRGLEEVRPNERETDRRQVCRG